MQSHPIQWQDLADQRVIYADNQDYLDHNISMKPVCSNENGQNCTYTINTINGKAINDLPLSNNSLNRNKDYESTSKPMENESNNNEQEFPSDDIASCDIAY